MQRRGKRRAEEMVPEPEAPEPGGKRRRTARANTAGRYKGLRLFSKQVCDKVQELDTTSYNDVADALVEDLHRARTDGQPFDEKNIRRRVYDALNVLMALNVITKEKKVIRWAGLPSNSAQELEALRDARARSADRIRDKVEIVRELIMQQVALRNLVGTNEEREATQGTRPDARIHLPFIVVNTARDTVIDCEMGDDRQDIRFDFSQQFEIHDDHDVLKRLGYQSLPNGASLDTMDAAEIGSAVPDELLASARSHHPHHLLQQHQQHVHQHFAEWPLTDSLASSAPLDGSEADASVTMSSVHDALPDAV